MAVSERTRRALDELGLTSYEIRAYTTLLERGTVSASELSKEAGVPYSKVYEVLTNLEAKGWIETESGKPTKYYPKSPTTAIETLRMRQESERRENENQILSELMPLYERREVHERPDIWIIRGEFNILSKVRETLLRSEKELLVAAPMITHELSEIMRPVILALSGKGVAMMVMTSRNVNKDVIKELATLSDVRIRDTMFAGGIISDAREVVLLLGNQDGGGPDLAIWSDHIGLAQFAKNYFEYLWKDSYAPRGLASHKAVSSGRTKLSH